jgi:transcriptional regulator with XRE-family HTH domain
MDAQPCKGLYMNNMTQGQAPQWTLGDRLRKVRRDAGYSARDFANVLGINVSSLAHYETDRAQPRALVELAQRIELTTGVPATWVLGLGTPCPDTVPRPAPPTAPLPVQPLYVDVPLFSEAV